MEQTALSIKHDTRGKARKLRSELELESYDELLNELYDCYTEKHNINFGDIKLSEKDSPETVKQFLDEHGFWPDYVYDLTRDLGMSPERVSMTIDMVRAVEYTGSLEPQEQVDCVVAAAVYASGLLLNERNTQEEVSNWFGITEHTVRRKYEKVLEAYSEQQN